MVKKKKKKKRIFVKIKSLRSKMHYKIAVVDTVKLSGISVFLTHGNRWDFKLLGKKTWGAGDSTQNLSNQPAQGCGLWKGIPERSQLLKPTLQQGERDGGDESLRFPLLHLLPTFPLGHLSIFEALTDLPT